MLSYKKEGYSARNFLELLSLQESSYGGYEHGNVIIRPGETPDISQPSTGTNTDGKPIDPSQRVVQQLNIDNILSKVKFRPDGYGEVGFNLAFFFKPDPNKKNHVSKVKYGRLDKQKDRK